MEGFVGGFVAFWVFLVLLIAGFFIFLFAFWIWMIIDCVKRKFKNEMDKVVWMLLLIFTGILGALIYYFIVKKKN